MDPEVDNFFYKEEGLMKTYEFAYDDTQEVRVNNGSPSK